MFSVAIFWNFTSHNMWAKYFTALSFCCKFLSRKCLWQKMTNQEKEPYFYANKIQILISPMLTNLRRWNSVWKYHVWQTEVLLSFLLPSNSAEMLYSHITMVSHCCEPAHISAHIDNWTPRAHYKQTQNEIFKQTTALHSLRCKL